ncbi:MAG: oxidative damage protection protein [Vicinamibacteria bacterium]
MSDEYKVNCVKLGAELPGLDKPPFSSPLGQRIYTTISKQAWDLWQDESRIVMNHYGLSMADPESRKRLRDEMEAFLFGPPGGPGVSK